MGEYRFHLQKYQYGSKITCPACGKNRCFVKYIDEENEINFPDFVGKCDHDNSCRYHYTPKDYFKDNPDVLRNKGIDIGLRNDGNRKCIENNNRSIAPSFIPINYVERSLSHYNINPLYAYFCKEFGEQETQRLFRLYRVGTSSKWGGSAVFWQTDINGLVRTGKVMCYNPETGHRVKEPQAFVSWAHSELHLKDFHLKQCLFGEHLLLSSDTSHLMLVESEKTAIIMSHFIPDYIWLATGGENGCFNKDTLRVLNGREITLLPDLGATDLWKEKAALLSDICRKVKVSSMLEKIASDEQQSQGLAIADFFLFSPSKRQILQQMIQRNPTLQLLIDKFDLELIE